MKKNKNVVVVIIYTMLLCVIFSSCSQGVDVDTCENPTDGKAILVAYRVARHSHLWFQNPETKRVYDIGSVGGRREPNISLGDTIEVQYCNGEIVFDRYEYVKQPINRETRFVYLDGFDNLY